MRKNALILCLLLNSFWSFGLSDTLLKKKSLYFGVNYSSLKLINEYTIGPYSDVGGKAQMIKGLNSYEFSVFTRIHINERIYVTPTFCFNKLNFLNKVYISEYSFGSGYYKAPTLLMSFNAEIQETVNNLKLYLPVGRVKNLRKHLLFFEAGFGLNKILSVKDDLKLTVKVNKENKTLEELESQFLDSREFYKNFNTRLFFRFSSGINFRIFKKLFINTSALLETTYFKKIEYLYPAPGIARITRFAIYPGFSVGLMLKK